MLRLIVNNTHPLRGNVLSQKLERKPCSLNYACPDSFLIDFQEFSSNLYILRARDCAHELACEMVLEVRESLICPEGEEGGYFAPVMTCHLPSINIEKFNEKVRFNEYLQGILLFQFHIKILEQLFLFCEEKDAMNIILTLRLVDADCLEVYRRFFISQEQVTTPTGEHIKIVMPTDVDTYDKVLDFMDEIDKDLRQTLWRDQAVNPVFRAYIKEHYTSIV